MDGKKIKPKKNKIKNQFIYLLKKYANNVIILL